MQQTDWNVALLALTVWREASNQPLEVKQAIACSIRNRVNHGSWWGTDWDSVITKRWQYSSMTAPNDPNLVRWPIATDTSWQASMEIAQNCAYGNLEDNSGGATSYFDKSLDANPPKWATDGSNVITFTLGDVHFYKLATG